jgi:hypothetical protein
LQLSDLLTGSIYGELTNVQDKVKLSIINNLKLVMKVNGFSKNINHQKDKFKLEIKTWV